MSFSSLVVVLRLAVGEEVMAFAEGGLAEVSWAYMWKWVVQMIDELVREDKPEHL
jgi:hypothetical protein